MMRKWVVLSFLLALVCLVLLGLVIIGVIPIIKTPIFKKVKELSCIESLVQSIPLSTRDYAVDTGMEILDYSAYDKVINNPCLPKELHNYILLTVLPARKCIDQNGKLERIWNQKFEKENPKLESYLYENRPGWNEYENTLPFCNWTRISEEYSSMVINFRGENIPSD
jgi:hypothetical protein